MNRPRPHLSRITVISFLFDQIKIKKIAVMKYPLFCLEVYGNPNKIIL